MINNMSILKEKRISILYVIITIVIILLFTSCEISQSINSDENNNTNNSVPHEINSQIENNQQSPPQDNLSGNEQYETQTFNTITYGEWRGKAIKWLVLSIQDEKALVISEEILAIRQFHDTIYSYYSVIEENIPDTLTPITWADCSLRIWLNCDFYEEAFTDKEQQGIFLTKVETPDVETFYETYYSDGEIEMTPVLIEGSENTEDKLFCLSVDEANEYFKTDESRIAYFTATEIDLNYAISVFKRWGWNRESMDHQLSAVFGGVHVNEASPRMWWLRNSTTYVHQTGSIYVGSMTGDGDVYPEWPGSVRPAMWVQLDSVEF